ncbi:hypothetical protein NI385_27210 (plasmid) [Vibrio parahaemolyticus]|nr:hypothetical protein NI385_27210 [Vibrio parahaemolyticus]
MSIIFYKVFMASLPLFIVVAFAVALGKYKFKHEITKGEIALNAVISSIVVVVTLGAITLYGISETEILNGEVTAKKRNTVSCEHSYEVCKKTSDGEKCETKYEHSWDYDWDVYTTVGTLTIDREDSQGVIEPKRFKQVVIGEPASVNHTYLNYVKANTISLFGYSEEQAKQYQEFVPKYPTIYDYYRVNRVLHTNPSLTYSLTSGWNEKLNNEFRTLGGKLQANMVIVVTDQPASFFESLIHSWEGGRKNDILIVMGVKDGKVVWSRSSTFMNGMGNGVLLAKLRQATLGYDLKVDSDKVLNSILDVTKNNFSRHAMENEIYQLAALPISWTSIFIAILVSMICSAFLSFKLSRNQNRERVNGLNNGWR